MIIVTRVFQLLTLVFSISALYLSSTHLSSFIDKIKKERDEARFQMEKSSKDLAGARMDFLTINILRENERRTKEILKRTQDLLAKKEELCKDLSLKLASLKASESQLEMDNQKLSSDLKFQVNQNTLLKGIIDLKSYSSPSPQKPSPQKPIVTISPPPPEKPIVTISPPSHIIRKK